MSRPAAALLPAPPSAPLTPLQRRLALGFGALGALIRMLYVFVIHPPSFHVYSDMAGYVYRATALVSGQPQTIADTIYPPGNSLFLAGLYRLDKNWNLAVFAEFWLSAGSLALIWWLARRLYGNRVAIVTLAAVGLYLPLVHYAGVFLAENPFAFLVLLTLALFVRTVDAATPRRAVAWALLTGLVAGVASSIKTTIFGPLAVVGTVYALLAIRHGHRHWPWVGAAVLAGVACCVVPMSLHCTKLLEGRFCLIATNGPMNILQGHYGDKFMFYWRDDARNYHFEFGSPTAEMKGWTDSASFAYGAYETDENMKRVWEYVRAHPGSALRQSVDNVIDLFAGRTIWPRATLLGRDFGRFYQRLYWIFVLPAALAFLATRAKPMLRGAAGSLREWLLLGPLVGLMALIFIAEGEVRYRIPFDPLVLTLAAAGYVALADWLLARRAARSGVAAAGASA